MSLTHRAWKGIATMAVIMAVIIFLPVGVDWWEGWAYLATFVGASVLITLWLMRNDPALLERRMKGGSRDEALPVQKLIMRFVTAGFFLIIMLPGLDRRFDWSQMPVPMEILGDVLVAIGMYIVFRVYRANSFTSATIEVAADQNVVSTGPYAIVRHPMYSGGIFVITGTALALGSWWALLASAFTLVGIGWRAVHEEKFLAANLTGYAEYRTRVRYRMVPGIW